MTTLKLTGLKGHHPLGFLAACGLLRCCAMTVAFQTAKLAWIGRPGTQNFVGLLSLEDGCFDLTVLKHRIINQLVLAADLAQHTEALSWSPKIRVCPVRYRKAAKKAVGQCDTDRLAYFASFAVDFLLSKKGVLKATPFDMTSAKQKYLGLIKTIAKSLGTDGKPLPLKYESDEEDTRSPSPRKAFEEALFGPWRYHDNIHSHGRDPATQRLHAVMWINPNVGREKQGIPGVRAAVFLASQALPLFPCFAVDGRLRTTGFHREEGDDWFAWPIWRAPISLDVLRCLLAHPFNLDLKRRGVEVVFRCRRVRTGGSEGNYQVFGHSEQRQWPSRARAKKQRA